MIFIYLIYNNKLNTHINFIVFIIILNKNKKVLLSL
jgi:hypothetical protein